MEGTYYVLLPRHPLPAFLAAKGTETQFCKNLNGDPGTPLLGLRPKEAGAGLGQLPAHTGPRRTASSDGGSPAASNRREGVHTTRSILTVDVTQPRQEGTLTRYQVDGPEDTLAQAGSRGRPGRAGSGARGCVFMGQSPFGNTEGSGMVGRQCECARCYRPVPLNTVRMVNVPLRVF